jgi:hypothetical protein
LVVLDPQVQAAQETERCILVSRKGDVIRAKSAKTEETLFKNSDAKKVIEWALENGSITILEPGIYTVNEAVRISRSNTSLIIKENASPRSVIICLQTAQEAREVCDSASRRGTICRPVTTLVRNIRRNGVL